MNESWLHLTYVDRPKPGNVRTLTSENLVLSHLLSIAKEVDKRQAMFYSIHIVVTLELAIERIPLLWYKIFFPRIGCHLRKRVNNCSSNTIQQQQANDNSNSNDNSKQQESLFVEKKRFLQTRSGSSKTP